MTIIKEPEAPVGQTLGELAEEVYAQGFDDFVGNTEAEKRVFKWINTAYQEVVLFKDWPFLESEYEGVLPTTLANLGKVLDVVSVNNRYNLRPADRRELIRFDPALEGAGNIAERWYKEGNGKIAVYPAAGSETFRVRFTVVPEELTEASKQPIIPKRFQYLLVDGACIRAYRSRDAYTAAEAVERNWDKGVETMVKQLLNVNHDMSKKILRSTAWRGMYW